jgi:hypothetical protein
VFGIGSSLSGGLWNIIGNKFQFGQCQEKKVENETQILKNEKDMGQIETERKRKKSLQKEINDLEKDEKISDFKRKNKISMIRNMSFKM